MVRIFQSSEQIACGGGPPRAEDPADTVGRIGNTRKVVAFPRERVDRRVKNRHAKSR